MKAESQLVTGFSCVWDWEMTHSLEIDDKKAIMTSVSVSVTDRLIMTKSFHPRLVVLSWVLLQCYQTVPERVAFRCNVTVPESLELMLWILGREALLSSGGSSFGTSSLVLEWDSYKVQCDSAQNHAKQTGIWVFQTKKRLIILMSLLVWWVLPLSD